MEVPFDMQHRVGTKILIWSDLQAYRISGLYDFTGAFEWVERGSALTHLGPLSDQWRMSFDIFFLDVPRPFIPHVLGSCPSRLEHLSWSFLPCLHDLAIIMISAFFLSFKIVLVPWSITHLAKCDIHYFSWQHCLCLANYGKGMAVQEQLIQAVYWYTHMLGDCRLDVYSIKEVHFIWFVIWTSMFSNCCKSFDVPQLSVCSLSERMFVCSLSAWLWHPLCHCIIYYQAIALPLHFLYLAACRTSTCKF